VLVRIGHRSTRKKRPRLSQSLYIPQLVSIGDHNSQPTTNNQIRMPLHASNPWRAETYWPGSLGVNYQSRPSSRRTSVYEPRDTSEYARSSRRYVERDNGYISSNYTDDDGFDKKQRGRYHFTEDDRPRLREPDKDCQRARKAQWYEMTDRMEPRNDARGRRQARAELYDNNYEIQRQYHSPRRMSTSRRASIFGEGRGQPERREESRSRRTERAESYEPSYNSILREEAREAMEATARRSSPDRTRTRSPARRSRRPSYYD